MTRHNLLSVVALTNVCPFAIPSPHHSAIHSHKHIRLVACYLPLFLLLLTSCAITLQKFRDHGSFQLPAFCWAQEYTPSIFVAVVPLVIFPQYIFLMHLVIVKFSSTSFLIICCNIYFVFFWLLSAIFIIFSFVVIILYWTSSFFTCTINGILIIFGKTTFQLPQLFFFFHLLLKCTDFSVCMIIPVS